MEEITMERLLNDFSGVINEFNNLVSKNDFEGVKKVLKDVENLLNTATDVELDQLEDKDSDHILHHLLRNLDGKLERTNLTTRTSEKLIISSEYRERYELLEKEEKELTKRIDRLRGIATSEISVEDTELVDRTALEQRITELQNIIAVHTEILDRLIITNGNPEYIVNNQERIKEAQEELAEIRAQLALIEQDERLESVIPALEDLLNESEHIAGENFEGDVVKKDVIRAKIEEYKKSLERPNIKESAEELKYIIAVHTELLDRLIITNGKPEYIINNQQKIKEAQEKLQKLKALPSEKERKSIEDKISELENLLRNSNPELEFLSIEEIQRLIEQYRQQLRENRTKINSKIVGSDYEKLIAKLEERLRRIRQEKLEIEEKHSTKHIEVVENVPETEVFDVKQAVNEIGDKIFKTAQIRRELANRDVSREEFLEFYKSGRKIAEANIAELNVKATEMIDFIQGIFVDKDSEKSLQEQLNEASLNNEDLKKIEICEKIRKRILASGKVQDELLTKEIKTIEDANEFSRYIDLFSKKCEEELQDIDKKIKDQNENIGIFDYEIKVIEDEQKSLNQDSKYLEKAEKEKALRERQIRASMFGDKELEKQWDETFKRYYDHKVTKKEQYVDKNGETKEIEYQTISDYPEQKDDAYFLNLEEYKMNLELVTKYRNSGGDIYALGPAAVEKFKEASKVKGEEKALEDFHIKMAELEKYVDTFHGLANEQKIKYENYKTAGSTLKSMVPVKGLPPAEKAKAITSNVFRFLGIRAPKFTKIDDHGNEVRDIKGGIGTLVVDAVVIAGAPIAIALGGVPATTIAMGYAIGYGAKGAVTIGNKVAGGITKKRHSYEIDNNIPSLSINSKDSREVARRAYYREKYKEETGKEHKIRAWFKARIDKYITRKRAKETEESIVAKKIAENEREIDEKVETIQSNIEKSNENQNIRQENFRKVARSEKVYNDIVKDPDSVDIKQAEEAIAHKGVLGTYKSVELDVNPNSKIENKNQYVKLEEDLKLTGDLEEVREDVKSQSITAITEEQHYTGRQEKQDRINRVLTVLLTIGAKVGIDALRKRFVEEYQLPDTTETVTNTRTVEKEVPEYGEVDIVEQREIIGQRDIIEQQTVVESPDTLSEYNLSTDMKDNVYNGQQTPYTDDIVYRGNVENLEDPTAFAIKYIDKNGNELVASIAEEGSKYSDQIHVHSLGAFDGKAMNPESLIEEFRKLDAGTFDKIVKDLGMENASAEEIWGELGRKGEIYFQGKNLEGWQMVNPENFVETTKDVVIGTENVVIGTEDVVVGTKIDQIGTKIVEELEEFTETIVKPGGTEQRISGDLILDSVIEGAAAGAVIADIDTLHEAAHQTKKVRPGTFEEVAPKAYFDKIVKIGQEKSNKNKEEKSKQDEDLEK